MAKETKIEKVYVSVGSFMDKGIVYHAEFDKNRKRNYFLIDDKMPKSVVDFIYKKEIKKG